MHLDGTNADEEAPRDLLVRQPVSRDLDHPPLRRGQLPGRLPLATPDAGLLRPGLLRPAGRTQLVEPGRGALERVAGGRPLSRATLRASEEEQRPAAVEVKAELGVIVGRALERRRRVLVVAARETHQRGAALGRHQPPRMLLLAGQLAQPSSY